MTDLIIDLIRNGFTIEFKPGYYPDEVDVCVGKSDITSSQRISLVQLDVNKTPNIDPLSWAIKRNAVYVKSELMVKELNKFIPITGHYGIVFSDDPIVGTYYKIHRIGEEDLVCTRRTKKEAISECEYLEKVNYLLIESICDRED